MSLKLVFALITVAMATATSVFAGGESSGGGGIAEQSIVFTYQHLDKYIDTCLAAASCGLSTSEKDLLSKIRNSLAEEIKSSDASQIVFRSGKLEPGFFVIDELVRVAKTAIGKVGAPVFVNLDLLYPKKANGDEQPMDIPAAVAMFVHEFGHHQGVLDHEQLDLLGAKVRAMVQAESQYVPLKRFGSNITAIAIQTADGFTQLLLDDGKSLKDISQYLRWEAACPGVAFVTGYRLWNLRWERSWYDGFDSLNSPLRASIDIQCRFPEAEATMTGQEIFIDAVFGLEGASGKHTSTDRFRTTYAPVKLEKTNAIALNTTLEFNGKRFAATLITEEHTWIMVPLAGPYFLKIMASPPLSNGRTPIEAKLFERKSDGTEIKVGLTFLWCALNEPQAYTRQSKIEGPFGTLNLEIFPTKP